MSKFDFKVTVTTYQIEKFEFVAELAPDCHFHCDSRSHEIKQWGMTNDCDMEKCILLIPFKPTEEDFQRIQDIAQREGVVGILSHDMPNSSFAVPTFKVAPEILHTLKKWFYVSGTTRADANIREIDCNPTPLDEANTNLVVDEVQSLGNNHTSTPEHTEAAPRIPKSNISSFLHTISSIRHQILSSVLIATVLGMIALYVKVNDPLALGGTQMTITNHRMPITLEVKILIKKTYEMDDPRMYGSKNTYSEKDYGNDVFLKLWLEENNLQESMIDIFSQFRIQSIDELAASVTLQNEILEMLNPHDRIHLNRIDGRGKDSTKSIP